MNSLLQCLLRLPDVQNVIEKPSEDEPIIAHLRKLMHEGKTMTMPQLKSLLNKLRVVSESYLFIGILTSFFILCQALLSGNQGQREHAQHDPHEALLNLLQVALELDSCFRLDSHTILTCPECSHEQAHTRAELFHPALKAWEGSSISELVQCIAVSEKEPSVCEQCHCTVRKTEASRSWFFCVCACFPSKLTADLEHGPGSLCFDNVLSLGQSRFRAQGPR